MNKKQIYEARKFLRKENRKYGPGFALVEKSEWPKSDQGLCPFGDRLRVYRNDRFFVQEFKVETEGVHVLLGINRTEVLDCGRWEDGISWDELMKVKDGVGYGDWSAVEAYPRRGDVVNVANIRWLFVLTTTPGYFWS